VAALFTILPAYGGRIRQNALKVQRKREFLIDNLLVRIHYIIVMIKWTGHAPWEFELYY